MHHTLSAKQRATPRIINQAELKLISPLYLITLIARLQLVVCHELPRGAHKAVVARVPEEVVDLHRHRLLHLGGDDHADEPGHGPHGGEGGTLVRLKVKRSGCPPVFLSGNCGRSCARALQCQHDDNVLTKPLLGGLLRVSKGLSLKFRRRRYPKPNITTMVRLNVRCQTIDHVTFGLASRDRPL